MTQFATSLSNEIFQVKIPTSYDGTFNEDFASESQSWLLQPAKLYILDFSGHIEIKNTFYRAVVLLHQTLQKNGRGLASVGVHKDLRQQLTNEGVAKAFNPVNDLEEAKAKFFPQAKAPAGKSPMDTRFIKPFVDATLKTLSMQTRTEGHLGKPFVRRPEDKITLAIDIAGVINLASDKYKGSIIIGFPAQVFLKIYENMFDEKHTQITAEIQDAAAEILNIIYGAAKAELNKTDGCDFKPALPTVLSGEKLDVRASTTSPTIVLPFETTAGPFLIEVTVERAG